MSSTLDLSNYTTVWDDDFATDSSLNTNLWPVAWGNNVSVGNGSLTIASYASQGWTNSGIIQGDFSASDGEGYGLYQFTASFDANQGVGICACLWPADNIWPGPELDMLESADTTRQTAYSTIHWEGSGDSNQYQAYPLTVDMTQTHTYAMDWEPGSITYYIDGQEIYQNTTDVPKDYADGGTNEAMSFEVTAASTGTQPSSEVDMHVYNASYSSLNSGSPSSSSSPSGSSSSSSSSSGSSTTPTPETISVTNSPGTLQAASAGAAVSFTADVQATGMTAVEYAVFTSSNQATGAWQTAQLNSSGDADITVQFTQSGEYLNLESPDGTANGWSSPVTITDPSTPETISVTNSPGTLEATSAGAAVSFTADVQATGMTSVEYAVFTSSNQATGAWQTAQLNGSGDADITVQFTQSGEYLNLESPDGTANGWSSPVTITDPPSSVNINADASYTATVNDQSVTATTGNHTVFLQGSGETLTVTGGGTTTVTASGGGANISLSNGSDTVTLSSSGNTVNAGPGYNTITDTAGGNTIVVAAAGQGWDRIVGNSFTDGDTFDMRAALSAAGWDGQASDLGNYLQAVPIATGNSLHINVNSGGSWTPVLTLWGQGGQTLAAFEQHATL